MKVLSNKFLLILILSSVIFACKPTEFVQSNEQQLSTNNCQYKLEDNKLSTEPPFFADIGHIKVEDVLKKCPELQKASSSFIKYAGEKIQMPNTYMTFSADTGWLIFQFDENTDVLQNITVLGAKQSFQSAKEELKKRYHKDVKYTAADFEAISLNNLMSIENKQQYLEQFKDKFVVFKEGSVLITLGKDQQNKDKIAILYQNSDYFPILKSKILPNEIIQSLGRQQITEDIGHIKVEEALKKYPKLQKSISSTISYAKKRVDMPNSYGFILDDGTIIAYQFDEKTNILQSICIINLKQSFELARENLQKYYSIYPQLTAAEFKAVTSNDQITFENHRQFLEEHKDKIIFFKKDSVLISLGQDSQDEGSTILVYLNSDYLPVLKEKAAAIK